MAAQNIGAVDAASPAASIASAAASFAAPRAFAAASFTSAAMPSIFASCAR